MASGDLAAMVWASSCTAAVNAEFEAKIRLISPIFSASLASTWRPV